MNDQNANAVKLMNAKTRGSVPSTKPIRLFARAMIVAGLLLCAGSALAQLDPGYSSDPTNTPLDSWTFYDHTNWTSDLGYAPVSFTNISTSLLGDFNSLVMDTNVPAWLRYNVYESDGTTNLTVSSGTVTFWFGPGSWAGTNMGGTGPGEWGRLFEVGNYTTNSSEGWWSIYVDDGGNNLFFSAQTNDLSGTISNYITCPIYWTTNYFHFIALTYSPTNTALYLDGALAATGPGVTVYPGPEVLSNGFCIGSDPSGIYQAHGMFDWVATYNYPLDSNDVETIYQSEHSYLAINPFNIAMEIPFSDQSFSIGTNLGLTQFNLSMGYFTGMLTNTALDVLYELQGRTNLNLGNWVSEGFLTGSELVNWSPITVPAGQSGNLFLRIRSWQDTTGTGIPDWWWLLYFGQTTNVDAYAADPAGDGYTDMQKFLMGLNPNLYYNTNGPPGFFGYLDASGTNALLAWSPSPGPVINYAIQRGILNTNTGSYVYSQIGLVSSNATVFEDVGAITNDNAQNNIYTLSAVYPGGSLSGTDTWQVAWYLYGNGYAPAYGPPMPGSVWANADMTGTNILLSWTAAVGPATNYLILHGVFNQTNYVYDFIPIANVSSTTTNFEIFGAITNLSNWTDVYEIEAVYPGGGLSSPIATLPDNASSYVNVGANRSAPTGPTNFYGYADSTTTNIFLTWTPVTGAVTNYLIYGGVVDDLTGLNIYYRLAKLGAGTNTFEVAGAVDGSGNNLYSIYSIVAVYTNSSLSQSSSWYPYNGAPAPGALSAYLDSTGTNIMLAWTPAQGMVTGYTLSRSADGGYTYSSIGSAGTTASTFEDVNGVAAGFEGLAAMRYEVQATYSNGGSSSPTIASVSTNLPAPGYLSVNVDGSGTNVVLSWSPALGAVTGYTIFRGTYNQATRIYSFSQIGTVGSGTTTFTDTGAATSGVNDNDVYEVEADYGSGIVSSLVKAGVFQSSAPAAHNLNVTAQLVRNQAGRWQLMFSTIPANVQSIAFFWYIWDYFDDGGAYSDKIDFIHGAPFTTEIDISVSSITNGIYVLPDLLLTNWFPNNYYGKVAMIQPIGTNNEYGRLSQAGFQPDDSPVFVDGRQHLKQNLLYELRAASISQPNVNLSENNVWITPSFFSISIPTETNYVESSIFHQSQQFKSYANTGVFYPGFNNYLKMDDTWPFTVNYQLHPGLYDPNFSGTAFVWQPNAGSSDYNLALAFQGTLATIPAPAVLGVGDPYWISQPFATSGNNNYDPGTGLPIPPVLSFSDLPAYTNGSAFYLESGMTNLFGLAFASALVNQGGTNNSVYPPVYVYPVTVAPGGSTATTNVNCFFSQTADPTLQLVNYYFAPVNTPGTDLPGEAPQPQAYPLPCLTGFTSTNQTGLLVASVGNSAVIGGWAKFSIQNGSSSKYAYLGQYFVTNAFLLDSGGATTTNNAGIVSPYGEFFPMQAGVANLVTMPDIDTGAQGTGVVRVVALNVDANHDGTMDFSYQGPDFVSTSKPFRFWVNDNYDSGDFGGNYGVPGQNIWIADAWNYVNPAGYHVFNGLNTVGYPIYNVHGRRDLVDYFPVYLNIGSLFQSNSLSAGISVTDTNYQFVLSQADGVLRFVYTDLTPTNYMNFLQDTNESGLLADALATAVTASGVALTNTFVTGIATNNQGIILVDAAEPTTQPLVLTIYHGTNQIAQTSLPLSISGVEQMFRHKSLLLSESPAMPDRLTDADVPNEPDTIDKNFVFLHGYNVDPSEARGVQSDMFKRMYWAGSHAKFYGVTWEGSDTKHTFPFYDALTPNYHTNVVNAFATAPLLANFIATLTNSGPVVAAAHSLGNMVVLSAISDWNAPISQYFMMDAAVPIEAIDPSATTNMMIYSTWTSYSNRVFASDWYQLFPTNDARSTLFWNNRLGNLQNVDVYNFYSSGEEVLRTTTNDPPASVLGKVLTQATDFWPFGIPFGSYTWYWQEKGKGTCTQDWFLGSSHGGWYFPVNQYNDQAPVPPATANSLPASTLMQTPVFNFGSYFDPVSGPFPDLTLTNSNGSGSTYAAANRNRILADAIPALSLVAGANPVPKFNPTGHNLDMMTLENGWSLGRTGGEANKWHHSDFVQMAYTFTYQLFNQFVTIGNLK